MANVKEEVTILLGKYLELVQQIKTIQDWEKEEKKDILTIAKEAPKLMKELTAQASDILWPDTEQEFPEQNLNKIKEELEEQEDLLKFGLLKFESILTRIKSLTLTLNSLLKPSTIPKATLTLFREVGAYTESLIECVTTVVGRINNIPSSDDIANYVIKIIEICNKSQSEFAALGKNLENLIIRIPKFRKEIENILQKLSPEKYAQIATQLR